MWFCEHLHVARLEKLMAQINTHYKFELKFN